MTDAVVVENLGKRFRIYHANRPGTWHEALLRGFDNVSPADTFWGLRDVSFRVAPGRMVGVVGRNGAGKSTLLRLIGGVGRPDQGSVRVHGRVGALLNLGVGFHPELTGRENVFVSGVIGGLTRKEVAARLDAIVAFSELEEYLDSPLRVYSTGMHMRLAFSVAIHSEPDVLLVDEVLGVGDYSFQRKCIERIGQLKNNGCAVLFVSHEASAVEALCEEAIWLRAGQLAASGPPADVIRDYLAEMNTGTAARAPEPAVTRENDGASALAKKAVGAAAAVEIPRATVEITGVRLLDSSKAPAAEIDSGAALHIEISYHAHFTAHVLNFRAYIEREDGTACCDVNTQASAAGLANVRGEGQIVLQLEQLDLCGGVYTIDISAYAEDLSQGFDFRRKMQSFTVRPTGMGIGLLRPPHRWETRGVPSGEPAPEQVESRN